MSIFASATQSQPIPIPFDPPHTIVVRKLTGRECDAAQEAHRANVAAGSPRSWAATFRRALEKGASDPAVLKAIADPLTGYDRFVLVSAGLVSWSYPQLIATPPSANAKDKGVHAVVAATRQQVLDDLDDEAIDFIATEVLRLTKPALFYASEEDAEAAQKEMSAAVAVL